MNRPLEEQTGDMIVYDTLGVMSTCSVLSCDKNQSLEADETPGEGICDNQALLQNLSLGR